MIRINRKAFLLSLCITIALTALLAFYVYKKSLELGPKVKVVIALTDIHAKTIITDQDIKEVSIPINYAVRGVVNNKALVIGKVVKSEIFKNEQLLSNRLVQGNSQEGLSAVIDSGFRAITIKADPVMGVGGNVKVGDYVDILVYLKPPYSNTDEVKTVFQKVEVIAVDGNSSAEDKFLTLSLKPEDAEKLFLINELGQVRFVLRHLSDREDINIQGFSFDSLQ